jgi:hypothetical protein
MTDSADTVVQATDLRKTYGLIVSIRFFRWE